MAQIEHKPFSVSFVAFTLSTVLVTAIQALVKGAGFNLLTWPLFLLPVATGLASGALFVLLCHVFKRQRRHRLLAAIIVALVLTCLFNVSNLLVRSPNIVAVADSLIWTSLSIGIGWAFFHWGSRRVQ